MRRLRRKLKDLGFPQVGAARFFINGLDTTTQGIDVVATYSFGARRSGSRWNLTAAYNHTKTKSTSGWTPLGPLPRSPGSCCSGGSRASASPTGSRMTRSCSAPTGIGEFGLTLRTTRYGKVISPGAAAPISNPLSLTDLGPDDIKLSAKWLTDLELRYKAFNRVELALGADNVFDVYPDRSPFGPRPASAGGGFYPVNQMYIPVFDLLAVRVQRPLCVRPHLGELLGGDGGRRPPFVQLR